MSRFLVAGILGIGLLAPAAIGADEQVKRYYDPYNRDYHEWNEGEERAYRHWLVEERHVQYHDWAHASKREQREYWQWRHQHPDWH